jgi:hypothetical protein
MVTEIMQNALIGLALGIGAGALGAFAGWASGGEQFIARKFVTGIVIGAIGGLLAAFAQIPLFAQITDELALLVIYGDIFAAGLVATWGVPKATSAINTRLNPTPTTQ